MEERLEEFRAALNAVCDNWKQKSADVWGFTISVDGNSIVRAHKLWQDILIGNPSFPTDPGPFKCAAGYLVVAKALVQFKYDSVPGADELDLTTEQKQIWSTRFIYKSLPLLLLQWGMMKDGNLVQLSKQWDVPTIHFRLDFLNFFRWTELPLEGPENPPPPDKPKISIQRTNRLIMALALIIESCYYQAENEVACDVKDTAAIRPESLHEDIQPDLFFDSVTPRIPG